MTAERMIAAVMILGAVAMTAAVQTGVFPAGALLGGAIRATAGLEMPDLSDPAMIRQGAAHYDLACAGCHGSPDQPERADHLQLTPPAPKLHERIEGWVPEILFRTVRDGRPDSGMPAWPTEHRDDEVWSMVAFLAVLPGLERDDYRVLAGLERPTVDAPAAAARCLRCHAADGLGPSDGAFPRLDIQSAEYLSDALHAFRDGQRHSGFMAGPAKALSEDDIAVLAEFFAGTPDILTSTSPPPLIASGIPAHKVPACAACHGPPAPARAAFPALAGQSERYLAGQLRLFAGETGRGGGPFAELMHEAARGLTPEDIAAVAAWYAAQRPGVDF